MLKVYDVKTHGYSEAIRGMRNPMNSWVLSDSRYECEDHITTDDIPVERAGELLYVVGPRDQELMRKLCKAGPDHRKFMRMITVSFDVIAPLYWWKEFDTYKIGTVTNSTSTMHKIHSEKFRPGHFSTEHMSNRSFGWLLETIDILNECRDKYNRLRESEPSNAKEVWWQIIQMLPSSYNQYRTVSTNAETLYRIYFARRNHKLDEWRTLCSEIEDIPIMQLLIDAEKTASVME